jgi:hypothetical protein
MAGGAPSWPVVMRAGAPELTTLREASGAKLLVWDQQRHGDSDALKRLVEVGGRAAIIQLSV